MMRNSPLFASRSAFPAPLDPIKARLTVLTLFCLLLASALLGRATWIQLSPNPRLERMALRQFQSKVLIQPSRGEILDRNGEPLAINSETSSLAVNPSKIQDKRAIARLLSRALDFPYPRLIKKFGEKREFAWIKRHLSQPDMSRLKRWRLIDGGGDLMSGLWIIRESERVYPHGELAAQVLGEVDLDSEGTEGTELWMNERLRGKIVSVTAIKDAFGRPAFIDANSKDGSEGKDGEPVTLTLDASLQFSVEKELSGAIRRTGARAGTVIVMNAANGEILAMANEPTFNPNDRSSRPDRHRDRALTDGFEPGSTMKAILLATALARGKKLSDLVWGERGQFKVQGSRIAESESHEKFEWLSLRKIIQVSSNIGAAKLALEVGVDPYFDMLRNFGFAAKTGTNFPGEISGRVPPRRAWQPLTLANIGFGQGILVTPMQMTRAYAAFINGGFLVEPKLLKSPAPAARSPKRILSQRVADQVVEALKSATQEGGTGTKAILPGYGVAGKTGTAQKVDPASGAYSHSKYVASFIGFPLSQAPKFVIFVSLDEPRGSYYASDTAAPLFREVLRAVASRFSLPATEPDAVAPAALAAAGNQAVRPASAPGGAGFHADPGSHYKDALWTLQAHPVPLSVPAPSKGALESLGVTSDGRPLWKMPSVRGLTPREAIQSLQGYPFHLELRGAGLVRSQFPEEGTGIANGDTVRLVLGDGSKQ